MVRPTPTPTPQIEGCTYQNAENYEPNATNDDGKCCKIRIFRYDRT